MTDCLDSPTPIACSTCAAQLTVTPSVHGTAGHPFRCVGCGTIIRARKGAAFLAITQAYRTEVASFCAAVSVAELADSSVETPTRLFTRELSSKRTIAAELTQRELMSRVPQAVAPAGSRPFPLSTPARAGFADASDQDVMPPGNALAVLPSTVAHDEPIANPAPLRPSFGADLPRARRALPLLSILILPLLALNVALIGWRNQVVEWMPQTGSLYSAIGLPVNLRGLSFSQLRTVVVTDGTVPMLVVTGTIVSASPNVVKVPRLHFSIRDRMGQEIYNWTALLATSALEPGKSLPFRSRLASPPRQTNEVVVRFLNSDDRVADIPAAAVNRPIEAQPGPFS